MVSKLRYLHPAVLEVAADTAPRQRYRRIPLLGGPLDQAIGAQPTAGERVAMALVPLCVTPVDPVRYPWHRMGQSHLFMRMKSSPPQ